MRRSYACVAAVLWVVLHCGWWCVCVGGARVIASDAASSVPADADLDVVGSLAGSHPSPRVSQYSDTGLVVVLAPPFRGHVMPLVRLSRELVRRGNSVTFVTYSPATAWVQAGAPGVKVVQLPLPISKEYLREARLTASRDVSPTGSSLVLLQQVYLSFYSSMHPGLVHVVSSRRPNVILADVTAVAAVDVGHQFHVPVVLNSPSLLFSGQHNPAWAPPLASGHVADFSLWGRMQRFMYPQMMSVSAVSLTLAMNQHRQALGLPRLDSPDQLLASTRVLVNTVFGFDHPRPTSPLHQFTGPILPFPMQVEPTGPAAQWLAEFADGQASSSSSSSSSPSSAAAAGVYVRLGSMPVLPKSFMSTVIRALGGSGLRVIWGMESKEQLRLRSKLKSWPAFVVTTPSKLSHFGLLASDAVSVVLSTCGMGMAMESLYFGKPLLCLPHIGDQFDVAARVQDAGAGLAVPRAGLTSKALQQLLLSVADGSQYSAAAARQSQILRATGGLDFAVHIVEADMRFGSRHLVPLDVKIPWHRALCGDIVALGVACVCVVLSGVRGLLAWWGIGRSSRSAAGGEGTHGGEKGATATVAAAAVAAAAATKLVSTHIPPSGPGDHRQGSSPQHVDVPNGAGLKTKTS